MFIGAVHHSRYSEFLIWGFMSSGKETIIMLKMDAVLNAHSSETFVSRIAIAANKLGMEERLIVGVTLKDIENGSGDKECNLYWKDTGTIKGIIK